VSSIAISGPLENDHFPSLFCIVFQSLTRRRSVLSLHSRCLVSLPTAVSHWHFPYFRFIPSSPWNLVKRYSHGPHSLFPQRVVTIPTALVHFTALTSFCWIRCVIRFLFLLASGHLAGNFSSHVSSVSLFLSPSSNLTFRYLFEDYFAFFFCYKYCTGFFSFTTSLLLSFFPHRVSFFPPISTFIELYFLTSSRQSFYLC